MHISILSIVFMAVSAILSIGTPIFLFLFFRKKFSMSAIPMLVGLAAFVVFALILEHLVHIIILKPSPTGEIALRNKPILYMLYGCFMAGIFEESARFIMFHLLKKKYKGIGLGLSYGIGHGGGEAIIIAGFAMIINLALTLIINFGSTTILPESIQGIALETIITKLSDTAPYMFLIAGIERIFAIAIQISLSVIVFYSVFCKGKQWLFPVAILIHSIIDAPAALGQTGAIKNVFFIEGFVCIGSVLVMLIARYIHKTLKQHLTE
jgi:uncharacterized membrane protein YhfC